MSVVWYSLLRLTFFVVPFGLMMLLPYFWEFPWLAAIFAALIGLSLSVIFLRKRRDAVAETLSARRNRVRHDDAAVEDAAVEDAALDDRR